MLSAIAKLSQRNRLFFDLGIILFFSVLVTLPMYLKGIGGGNDMPQHFQFAQTYYEALLNGNFYPSWAYQPNYGYGDVSVRFYPPLTYYCLAFFRILSGNWFDATCLTFLALFFASGVGIYLWAKEWFTAKASLVGALVYIFLPYHLNQIYRASMLAEFAAAAILPFCFLYAARVCQKGRLTDICGLALSFALLILTHLPTTVMASLTLFLYCLFSLKKTTYFQTIFKLAVSVSISLLLSSFYWVRMVTELNFVKHNSEAFSSGIYSYKSQFVFSYLFPFADVRSSSPTALMNVITLFTLGVFIPSFIFYLKARKSNKQKPPSINQVAVVAIFPLIMSTPLSLLLWEYFPPLQKIQFPFRWLTLFTLGSVVFAAAGFNTFLEYFKTSKRYLSLITAGLILICLPYNAFYLMNPLVTYPKDYFSRVVERFQISPSYECWWTIWAQNSNPEAPITSFPRPKFITQQIEINDREKQVNMWESTERRFTIEEGQAHQATVATLYYPHWKVLINNSPVEVTPTDSGLISFPVPSQQSQVLLYFQEPPSVVAAFYLSAFAWFFFLLLFSFSLFRHFRFSNPISSEQS